MPADTPTEPAGRLESVLAHTGTALRELRTTTAPGALSGVLAECWLEFLGPRERDFLLLTAAQAAEPQHLDELAFLLGGRHRWRDDGV